MPIELNNLFNVLKLRKLEDDAAVLHSESLLFPPYNNIYPDSKINDQLRSLKSNIHFPALPTPQQEDTCEGPLETGCQLTRIHNI